MLNSSLYSNGIHWSREVLCAHDISQKSELGIAVHFISLQFAHSPTDAVEELNELTHFDDRREANDARRDRVRL